MSVSVREIVQSGYRPTGFTPKPNGAESLRRPLDLLGADPDRRITYQSSAAEALLSAEAANLEAPYVRLAPRTGDGIDVRA